MSKNSKSGNNTNSQEIVDYILNISSYETNIEVEVNSNKNKNKYVIKQEYKEPNFLVQEVIEPSNIAGVKITKSESQLKLENTKLNLSSILESYESIFDNDMDLITFIEDYKIDDNSNWSEDNNQIIMVTTKNDKQKQLYVDKIERKPTKLQIKDINRNIEVYISYKEVNIK